MDNIRLYIIEQKLRQALLPVELEVIDESHNHNVPVGSESHFKVTIISDKFESISLIQRHRQINTLLQQEFDNGMHALAIHTHTPKEWLNKQKKSTASPKCLDGFKNN